MDFATFTTWLHSSSIAGISLINIGLALAAAGAAYLAMTLALRFVVKRLATLATRTDNQADDLLIDVLSHTRHGLVAAVALLLGAGLLDLPQRWGERVQQLWFVVLVLQLALWANRAVGIATRRYALRQAGEGAGSQAVSAASTLLAWGARTLVWAVVLLAMLSNLGVNITAFVASLGVGGIAVALAAQSILADLFASISIALDKPFEVGDFIVFGAVAGTVETVGVKTTRIRSLGGEQIVVSNTELLKQTLSNYKRLRERRIVFSLRLTYETTAEQAAAIAPIIERVVQQSTRLRFDRAHFKGFGEHALEYEVVYIVLSPEYGVYMDEQQRINLALMAEFSQLGVGFALPTRTVHLVGGAETSAAGAAVATENTTAAAPATS